jgi:hypothetical protein
VIFLHALSEAFRLACLLFNVISEPNSSAWIFSLATSAPLNILTRSQWQRYWFLRLTGCASVVAPHPISRVHVENRFTSAYCRFGGPVALMAQRACLGSKGPFYFNSAALSVLFIAFFTGLFEDLITVVTRRKGLIAPISEAFRTYFEQLPRTSPRRYAFRRARVATSNRAARVTPSPHVPRGEQCELTVRRWPLAGPTRTTRRQALPRARFS